MHQRLDENSRTLFLFAHHVTAPAIRFPKAPKVDYLRTLRLDPGESPTNSHLKLGSRLITTPDSLQIPSLAFSDSLSFLNIASLTEGYSQVGIFQHRRILGIPGQASDPVLHRYRIQSGSLLRAVEAFALSHKDTILVANPLRVASLEDQYATSQARTLHMLRALRARFQDGLEYLGHNLGVIKPELFFWSSLYLGPREQLLEFQALVLDAFQSLDHSIVPENLSSYESRWGGFIVERLFSDYIQCLANSDRIKIMFAPAIQLNRLPGSSRIFPGRT